MKFDKLEVFEKSFKSKEGRWKYRCVCDCGNECFRAMNQLKGKSFNSCGCAISEIKRTHGMRYTRVYGIWRGMKSRCTNKDSKDHQKYSSLGICKEWLDFASFFKDMGEPPTCKHQIDRIDNDKGYSRENCKWSTPSEQAINRSTSYVWIVNGVEFETIRDVAESFGVTVPAANRWFNGYKSRGRAYKPRDGFKKRARYNGDNR